MWEYTPAIAGSAVSGTWRRMTSSTGFTFPPVIRFQSVYDSDRDNIFIWHGVYESFNTAFNVNTTIYKWTWCDIATDVLVAHNLRVNHS